MRRFAPPVPRRASFAFLLSAIAIVGVLAPDLTAQQQTPFVDPNVNMVRGITFPDGDPYLQRQNEPSIAVSTRNPCHLVAGANDYRSVDIPFDDTIPPNSENSLSLAGDAWLGLFKSFDCGQKWQSTLLPGYPQDNSGLALELKGHAAGADPTVRAGTNGLFYYSGMAFNRGNQGTSKIFMARLVDNNNKEKGDPIEFLGVSIIDTGTKGQFLDKPWMAVDVPRNSFGPGSTLATGTSSASGSCTVNGQQVAAGNVYMAWARFTGDANQHSKLMFAKSSDCGKSWKQHPISNNQKLSQGANIAIAPDDGTIYLTWREFATMTAGPVNFWIATSTDGGNSFSNPKMIGSSVTTFDQLRSNTTFRSNALPAITADHQGRVYVAWSARGYGSAYNSAKVLTANTDARIVMTVSSDRGKTFGPIFPIDPSTVRGHQFMPSLTFAAGKIQAIYYDSREDVSKQFSLYIDDLNAGVLRHTVDIRGAQATPASLPVFGAGAGSLEISKYRQWQVGSNADRQSIEVGSNPPNLPMYANGSTPFIGDYIDVSGLSAFPVQTTSGQVWQPNLGVVNLMGASANNISTAGYPFLPVFHATWTDNRDVKTQQCIADPANPIVQQVGQRNANIYTARVTPGLFVGSPGNTKPFGFRINPKTGQNELIQRGFVVFAQNTANTLKYYEFKIMQQPAGGRASLRQFDKNGPLTTVVVSIPRGSTVARTLYATSTDQFAQILVNITEVSPLELPTTAPGNGGSKPDYTWPAVAGGLRGSVLLNPDRTNPKILDPDVDSDVPQIATDEVHDPSMFDAQFFRHTTKSRLLDVKNPDPENPDPENPDPENPDPENPDPENPDPENPDPENPDPENPDPENPDPENPDPENVSVLNSAISDSELASASITDVNWRIHNSGNTTSAYRFRPSLPQKFADQKYQLIVTRRSMALTVGADCKPIYKSTNQVLVNIENFQPKTPDPENPDPENPDPENPDPENPDPENPDPENPDPENANFFLSPDETATVTLRVFDLEPGNNQPAPTKRADVAAKTAAQAANTGETTVTTAVAGPDLTLVDVPATISPAIARPGRNASITFTLSNRGTGPAIGSQGPIKTRVYLSTDALLDEDDTLVSTINQASPFAFCTDTNAPLCSTTSTVSVPLPTAPGTYSVIVITDENREVFEADEWNNRIRLTVRVESYQLTFAGQPSATTQDFTIIPPVTVAITHPDAQPVTLSDVAAVTLGLQNNPGSGALAGTVLAPNAGGVASFNDLKINNVGTGYTLSASAVFANGAVSAPFNIEADLPPVAVNDSHSVNEDQALNIAAPGVLSNDSDPATKGTKPAAYVFNAIKLADPTNGSVTVNADGSFAYTPANGFTGTDSFTYQARDGRSGNATTGTATVTVTSVNDAPSFTAGSDQTTLEDAGAIGVPAWAGSISAGPANESSQAVDFIVTNDNNALFSSPPAIAANGTLTYTLAANVNGIATVTVRIHDNGGVANGGVDTSAPQAFTITVTPVNDPPVSSADSYAANEDALLTIDAGLGNGLLQNDSDLDTGTTLIAEYLSNPANGTLLPHQNGSFSYTPNADFFGVDSFTYRAFDGATTGNTVTVTVTVAAVNDVPSFTKGADQTAPNSSGARTIAGWATAISAGALNEAAQALTFIVTNSNAGIFSAAPAVAANGTLTFTPQPGQSGSATVTARLQDNAGVANGGIDTSAPQTFTITITGAPTTFVVTNTNDSGPNSLRQAILSANADPSADTVTFNIPGGGLRTIVPLSPLPTIIHPLVIDATTQGGFNGAPLIELNGASAGANVSGLELAANPITVRGLIVNRFTANGISIHGPGATVVGNYVGTDATGTSALGNGYGVALLAGSAVVGGTTAADRNLISGNINNGVQVQNFASAVLIKGNYIGTDPTGTSAVPNRSGVWIENVQSVQIGGDNPGEGNLISGNTFHGVSVYICPTTSTCSALIAGNKIGTDAGGTAAIPNLRAGIYIDRSPNTVIRANVISGNGAGVPQSPFHGSGISIISEDVAVDPQAELHFGNHLIVGNKIGTDVNGMSPVPNANYGIVLFNATKATIGGPIASDRNIIANSGNNGVHVGYSVSNNNIIQGNYIGVNLSLQPAGNQGAGVFITNSSSANTVSGNVIGANINGVAMDYGQQNGNTITGNFIGTDSGGTLNLGNTNHGVTVAGNNNVISQNRIANNGGVGIWVVLPNQTPVPQSIGNRLSQNYIFNNGQLGIDLDVNGVTANDPGDGDAGVNNLQNFPVIASAFVNGGVATILGSLNSAPSSTYTIEFFSSAAADVSGYGEGQNYLGSLVVTTDGSGNAGIAATLNGVTAGSVITATASDAAGNTSEFSQARLAAANSPPTATSDEILTVSDMAMTTTPASNDVDPDVAGPEVRTTYRPVAGAFGPLLGPGGVAVVTSTNRGYFTAGNSAAAATGKIGVLDLSTNAVVATIPLPGNFGAAFTEVDQTEQVVFFRGGINLLALDARPTSGTFHQLLLNINLGTINSWALDAANHRLYVTTQTTGTGLIAGGRITVFDTDRNSGANFLQVIAEASVPGLNGLATAIGVNTVTNKIFVAVTGSTPGLYGVDPATLAMTQIFSTTGLSNITSVAVNNVDNMIYAVGGTALHSVDGVTNTKIGQVTLTAGASAGAFDTRLLIHRGTGRVYVRLGSFPNPSNLVVVNGKPGSGPTFNTVVATIPLGRENSSAFMALDEGINRLIATSSTDLRSHIIDTTTNSVVGSPLMATQSLGRVSLDPTTHRVYLTGGQGYIKVADLSTAALVTDVHVATSLWGIAVDPLTHSVYVSETGLTTALKRVNETGVSGTIPLTHGDGGEVYMARNSATNKIYALNNSATAAGGSDGLPGFVHVIDGNTYGVTDVTVGNKPFGIAIDEANNKIYVGNQSQGQAFPGGISIIDGGSNGVVQANVSAIPSVNTPHLISVGRDMVVTNSGRLYFRVTAGAATQMLGTLTGTVAAPVSLGNVNVNIIRYNRVTDRLYVGTSAVADSTNQIFVIDPATNAIVTTLTVGSPTNFITTQSYIAMNTATNRLFISDFDEMQLHVLDATTHAVVASIPMPFGPSTVAVDEVHNRIYVGDPIKRSLTIVDGATLRVARTLALPIAPVALFVDSSLSPARIFALAVEPEGAISVIDDPGTAAPPITSVTQGTNGGAVVLNADGSVTYTPTTGYVGADTYTYTTIDGQGGTTTSVANVTVYAEMSIQPATLANGTVGQNYSQTLTRTGGSGSPVVWTVSGFFLPGGLHLSTSGVLSGKLLQSGTFTFTVNARDTGQDLLSETKTYTVVVGPPVIAPTSLANATVNTLYSQQLFAGGATGEVMWALNTNGHPGLSWLSLSSTGVLSGTPSVYGNTPSFTVTATDSATTAAQVATRSFSLNVSGPLTMTPLREGIVLEAPSSISFAGGSGGTRTATLTAGSLPPGVTLNLNGSWSGSPLRHGTYNFTLELRDCQSGSCGSPQIATKVIQWLVSAKDQQGSGGGAGTVPFGGTAGIKIAQVFTVGAQGTLTGIGTSPTCPTQTPLTIEIQRLTGTGVPDGTTIASGTSIFNLSLIPVTPALPVAIGERLAFVLSSPLACTVLNTTSDGYNAGDAYSLAPGGQWTSLFTSNASRDVPNFRTLIQPAMPVTYHNVSRNSASATLLGNGNVLVAGGGLAAELYDPAAPQTQTPVSAGNMVVQRQGHTATLLTNGTVVMIGGRDSAVAGSPKVASAEIYTPGSGFVATTSNLATARDNHRAARFTDPNDSKEKILISGGVNSSGSTLNTTEIYDTVTKVFSPGPVMLNGRQVHAAVTLGNGKILLAGGYTTGSGVHAELYDPATNTFTATPNMMLSSRGNVAATVLADGNVLLTGGQSSDVRNEAEIYNVATNSFAATTSPMLSPRMQHTATLLADGSVLIAGGYAEQPSASYTLPLATMERYLPASNSFVGAGGMATRRERQAALAITGTKILLIGGSSQSWMSSNTAEIYDRASSPSFFPTTLSNGVIGTPYAEVFNGQSGTGPYTFEFAGGQLPPGLSYNGGTVAGTPTTAGLYRFAIKVTDNVGYTNVQSLTLQVGTVNTITSPYRLTPDAGQGNPFTRQLTATGANNVWSLLPASSFLPPGITLSAGGLLDGIPTSTGYFNFGVRAVDNNGLGTEATKILSISVQSPLSITTTTLGNADLFSGNLSCLSTSGGNGSRFYTVLSGTPPPGLTLSGLADQSCFTGTATAPGTYNFTVKATDQSFPPQEATKNFTVNVWVVDQNVNSSSTNPTLPFGAGTGARLSQRLITGISGTLRSIRVNSLSCTVNNTSLSAEIQGLNAAGAPDGNTIATATGTFTGGSSVSLVLNAGVFFAADAPYTVVLDAGGSCSVKPWHFDNYPGDGYVSNGGGGWTKLPTVPNAMYDVPVLSLLEPVNGLLFMSTWRGSHIETLLPNGKVLITGGYVLNAPANLYDPATNSMAPTGTMTTVRQIHTATLLANGTVLLAGGVNGSGATVATAEIYDPNGGTFTLTAGSMSTVRMNHSATLLADGTILIAGGNGPANATLNSAELFDPATGQFTATPTTMGNSRTDHTATRLASGKVLLAGGFGGGNNNAVIYDPLAQTFTGASSPMTMPRGRHTATLLPNQTVLLAGGAGNANEALSSLEIFDPGVGNGVFSAAGDMSSPRVDHAAALLPDGSVLISGGLVEGGCCNRPPVATMERYVSGPGATNAGSMIASRYAHTMTTLGNGKVLVAGTHGWSNAGGRTAELFDAAAQPPYFVNLNGPNGSSGQATYQFTLQPAGGAGGPYTITMMSGALPANVSFDGTNLISGSIAAAQSGTYKPTFRIVDSAGRSSYQVVTLRVDPVTITTTSLPTAYQGLAYTGALAGSASTPITWSITSGSLPPGLTFNSASGAIGGSPTVSCCTYFFTFKATDTLGQSASKTLTINVQQPLQINTTSLSDWIAGNTYFGGLFASSGTQPYTWSMTGQPIGLTINPSTGQFNQNWPADVMRQAGSFTIQAQVVDSGATQQTATRNIALNVYAQDQSPNSGTAADVTLPSTRRFAQTFQASSPYPLRGMHLWSISCDANVVLTGRVFPVTGTLPDESGAPLGTGSLTSNASGYFMSSFLTFPTPVAMPQGATFAVVFSASGNCKVTNWPSTDYYSRGDAFISDNSGAWSLADTVVGRRDLPLTTLVMPASSLRFLAGYRQDHATAKLHDGRVFLIGLEQSTEIYDPATNMLALTANMSHSRQDATATLLQSGKVLVAGGMFHNGTGWVTAATTQLFNPATGQFEASDNMSVGRMRHVATLLANGNVLITGGQDSGSMPLQSADLFDGNGNHLASLSMTGARAQHTATLLPDGRVAIIGGWGGASPPSTTAEIYNPGTGLFSAAGSAAAWPVQHTATLLTTGPLAGQVLVVGGQGSYPNLGDSYFFDPLLPGFSGAPGLLTRRLDHTATRLPNGKIVFTGGMTDGVERTGTPSVETYDPDSGDRTFHANLVTDRQGHIANLVTTPTGLKLAVSGGWGSSAMAPRTIELLDLGPMESFVAATPMSQARRGHVAVQLNDGSVLLAGSDNFSSTAEIYNTAADVTSPTVSNMLQARCNGCAFVKLQSGKVLITGGWNGGIVFSSAEIYDPGTGQFSATSGNMTVSRLEHKAILLDTGKVLIVGGYDGNTPHASAELFDPATGTFAVTGSMSTIRLRATAIKLQNGKVLVGGGLTMGSTVVTTAELYDPVAGTFSPTGSMVNPRLNETPVLLGDGRVLIAGGWNAGVMAGAEVYNPGSGTFTVVGAMTTARSGHFAVKLLNGIVVVGGGENQAGTAFNSTEMFDPTTNTFAPTANLVSARAYSRAILLGDGRIMITGGSTSAGRLSSVEYYVP